MNIFTEHFVSAVISDVLNHLVKFVEVCYHVHYVLSILILDFSVRKLVSAYGILNKAYALV